MASVYMDLDAVSDLLNPDTLATPPSTGKRPADEINYSPQKAPSHPGKKKAIPPHLRPSKRLFGRLPEGTLVPGGRKGHISSSGNEDEMAQLVDENLPGSITAETILEPELPPSLPIDTPGQ
ncbi:hypothetical protein NMY22_g18057 [Coprinellus aureogranulatus]|nr:hypothetical protein NMY22_g18057 [Coprinellus aureogranulatus]